MHRYVRGPVGRQLGRSLAIGLGVSALALGTATAPSGTDPTAVPTATVTSDDGVALLEYREALGEHHDVVAISDGDEVVATAVVVRGGEVRLGAAEQADGTLYSVTVEGMDADDLAPGTPVVGEATMLAAQLEIEARLEGRPVEVPDAVAHLVEVLDGRVVVRAGASSTPFSSGSATISNSKAYAYGAFRRYHGGTSGGKTYYNDESKLYGNAKDSDDMVHLSTQHVYGGTSEIVNWSPAGRQAGNNCTTGSVAVSFGGVTWSEDYSRCASHHQGQTGQQFHYSTWYGDVDAGVSRNTASESLVAKTSGSSGFDYKIELRTCWWSCTTYKAT